MSGSGSSDGGYGGGSGRPTDCNLSFTATLSSPDPAVVVLLSPGSRLNLEAFDNPPRIVAMHGRAMAGGIANRAAELMSCIQQGNRYRAVVQAISGGVVRVRIERI